MQLNRGQHKSHMLYLKISSATVCSALLSNITSGIIVSPFIPGSKIKLTSCIKKFNISRSEYIENGLCSSFAESDISNIFKTLGHKSSQASNQKNMEERNLGSMQIIFLLRYQESDKIAIFRSKLDRVPVSVSEWLQGSFVVIRYLSN